MYYVQRFQPVKGYGDSLFILNAQRLSERSTIIEPGFWPTVRTTLAQTPIQLTTFSATAPTRPAI